MAAGGPIAYFARNPVAGNLLMVLLLFGGLYTAMHLEIQSIPEFDARQITVEVPYPGSSAREVEEDINRRIEERLIPLAGVERVTSRAMEGLATVVVDLEVFANPNDVLDDVQSAVDRLEKFPPPEAEQPEVALADVPRNVLTVAVSSSSLSQPELRSRAEKVREALLALPSVSVVWPFAVPEREISIEVTEEALRKHRLTIGEVAREVRQASLNLSSGELRTDAGGLVLRTQAKRARGEDFEDVVLLSKEDGTIVHLRDVAVVHDGFEDVELATEVDGRPVVLLRVDHYFGQEPLAIAEDVLAMLEEYVAPPGTDVSVWDDRHRPVSARVDALLASGFLGFSLVFVLLALVFDFRIALWVAVGVPTSFLGACLLFPAFDITINAVSIFALLIVIGIVVDDAVVVGESIATRQELGALDAAASTAGARAVLAPVVVGVLTTVIAFLPLLFTFGAVGQMLSTVPVVVALVLGVSLAEAFFVLPSHLAHGAPWSRPPLADIQAHVRGRVAQWRDHFVVPAISAAVRRPYLTVIVSVAFVAAAALLATTGAVRYVYLLAEHTGRVQGELTFPPGTPFAVTQAAAEQLAEAARRANGQAGDDPVRTVAVVVGERVGAPSVYGSAGAVGGGHVASVTVHLRSESERSLSPTGFERLWRANVGNIPGTESVLFHSGEERSNPSVSYALAHPERETLAHAVAELRRRLEADPALYEVEDSLVMGKRQYDIELTEAGKAAGMTPRMVAAQLRARFFGDEVQRIQRGRDEIKVVVRYPEARRHGLRELGDERITRPDGEQIRLSTVARVAETRGFSTLMRIDGLPAAEVRASVDTLETTPGTVAAKLGENVFPALAGKYPGLQIKLVGPARDDALMVGVLSYTVPLALLVMYILIAVQFRSYVQPFVVVAGLPFAFGGAIIGHWILGYDLTMLSVFGIVAVGGVVVNDTLVLMDRYNKIRAEADMPAVAAVSAAARQRFRPIILTTLTTVVGLLPLLLFKSEATHNLVPVVVSLVFGLIVASVAILFFVPAVLLIGETVRERLRG